MRTLLGMLLALCCALGVGAQQSPSSTAAAQGPSQLIGPPALPAIANAKGPGISLNLNGGDERQNLTSAIEIFLLMTVLSMAPAIVMTMTCFTRIVIVLSFLKRAMSMQDMPPTLVVTGFAVFLSAFVMKPVVTDIYDNAYTPYVAGQLEWRAAADIAADRMNDFLLKQTRDNDIALMLELSRTPRPATARATPLHITVPAFVLSEVKTAFQMGFVLFLPFVVIDLVISSILVSMGMFTLPPVVVSTPLKLLLFIMVGGWDLVVVSLAQSFTT